MQSNPWNAMSTRVTTVVGVAMIASMFAAVFALGVGTADAQKRKKKRDRAQDVKALLGDYDVKFEEIANNCNQTGMNLRKGTIALSLTSKKKRAQRFTLSVPIAPVMYGSDPSKGKFRVKAKRAGTGIQGVDGQFSASGRVNDGIIQFVYIAEYFTHGKPLCTQSWNVSGVKAD